MTYDPEELIVSHGSRGVRIHHRRKAWQQGRETCTCWKEQEAERMNTPRPQAQSKDSVLEVAGNFKF